MVTALQWFSRATLPLFLLGVMFSAHGQDSITIHNVGHASLCFEYNKGGGQPNLRPGCRGGAPAPE